MEKDRTDVQGDNASSLIPKYYNTPPTIIPHFIVTIYSCTLNALLTINSLYQILTFSFLCSNIYTHYFKSHIYLART